MVTESAAVRFAPGGPGIEPRWTRGAKLGVGTAYSTSSRVWYTLDFGCVTEVYYPTIDSPQIRDLQFLVTGGESFFHDERRNFTGNIDCISEAALGFEVSRREKEGRYSFHKTILADPHQNCLLIRTRVEAPAELLAKLRWFSEELPKLPVVAAGSLLDVALAEHSFSMPVGRIAYLHLEPMGFEEFLDALGDNNLVSPALAAWAPLLIFGPIALVKFDAVHT